MWCEYFSAFSLERIQTDILFVGERVSGRICSLAVFFFFHKLLGWVVTRVFQHSSSQVPNAVKGKRRGREGREGKGGGKGEKCPTP